jgi:hypothetical protein
MGNSAIEAVRSRVIEASDVGSDCEAAQAGW